jgi:uncharacterized protein YpuA (DUF1002 family)
MNPRGQLTDRPDNSDKLRTFIRDSENTMTLNLTEHHGNKFLGSWNKLINMQNMLFWEQKTKYLNEFNARFNSKLEIGSVPRCFNQCISDV